MITRDNYKDKLFEVEYRLDCLKELHKLTKSDGFIPLINDLEKKRAALLKLKV
jgi:hypothetical protein